MCKSVEHPQLHPSACVHTQPKLLCAHATPKPGMAVLFSPNRCPLQGLFRQEDLLPTAPGFAASPPSLGQRAQPLCSSCRELLLITPRPGPGEGLLAEPGSSNPTSLHIVALHRSALSCIAPHITPRFPSSSMVRGEGGTPLWGSIWGGEGTGASGAIFIVTFDKDRIAN